jgi:predicted dehydrogenase
MAPIRIAQLGCGYWGPNLLRTFDSLTDCRLTTVVELSEERRKFIQKTFPKTTVIEDWKAVAQNGEIDAVVIATPAETHFSLAKELLLAGKHVFVEKPLAMQTEHAIELADIADRQKLILMVGHTFLYNPAVNYLKQQLKNEIGELYYIYSRRLNLGIVRRDINVWWNLAPHDVSILLYLLNNELPESISVRGVSYLQSDTEDVAFAVLKWKNKVTASIHVSWLDPGKVRQMTLVGSRKMIVYDDISDEKVKIYDKGIDMPAPKHYDSPPSLNFSYRSGDIYIPKIPTQEPLKLEAEHFLQCIKEGKTPLTGPQHGVDVVAILEAGQRSLLEDGAVQKITNHTNLAKS